MTVEALKTKEELRRLIDDYAYLGDKWKISEVMNLFTLDVTYKVYMGGNLVGNTSGRATMEKEFTGHASQVKKYFTLNGQHTVKIDDATATGVSYAQIKMIRETDGKDVLTDYSVRYDDNYVLQNDKWLIKERVAHFVMVESRTLS
jgi:hypothetical protein